jgi:outer membrane protein insertion porin family
VLFFDFGNVFNTECPNVSDACTAPELSELRYAVGLGLTWLSGLGPLTFGVAEAFNFDRFDQTQFFQFELGRTF